MQRILVIEDEKDLAEMIKVTLEKAGYSVELAYDGQDGLQRAKNTNPSLIVLDLMIPLVDGYKVCEELKSEDQYKNIPIVVLTARDSKIEEKIGYAMGADVYLAKPYEPKTLLSKIKKLLGEQA
jgi:two-component system alkaline phosphatase synthesis response regulator PhoP